MKPSPAVDELYALPLGEFTAARNRLAKDAGDRELAASIRQLAKPSATAWVINAFCRLRRDRVDEVLALGAAFREAQDDLDRDALTALTKDRRRLIAALVAEAEEVAAGLGHTVNPASAAEIEQTLLAAMTDADAAVAITSGRLVRSLATVGLEPVDLTDAVADPGAAGRGRGGTPDASGSDGALARVTPLRSARSRSDRADRELREAQSAAEDALRDAEDAAARIADLDRRSDDLERRRDELAADLDELMAQVHEAQAAIADAERDARALDREREKAERSSEQARRNAKRARERLDRIL